MRPDSVSTSPGPPRARDVVVDVAVAVLLTLLAAYATQEPPGPRVDGPAWAPWLAGAAAGLPLARRRRWPVLVLVWTVVAVAVATATGVVGPGVIWASYLPVAIALYTVAATQALLGAGASLMGSLGAGALAVPWFYRSSGISASDATNSEVPLWWQVEFGVVAGVLVAAWAAGRVVRWRRAVQADWAARLAQDAVTAEQLRIARELHDIIGHSMTLIAVKATVANHLGTDRPEEVREALSTIEDTSRSALTEIRRLLGMLRSSATSAERSPTPRAADIPQLAGRLGETGLAVRVDLRGTDNLPPGVDLAVHRIVQEALTNVVKHANATHCSVTVEAENGSIRIRVVDDGAPLRSALRHASAGQGIIGMQERAGLYGGSVTVGPLSGGGFQVLADFAYSKT